MEGNVDADIHDQAEDHTDPTSHLERAERIATLLPIAQEFFPIKWTALTNIYMARHKFNDIFEVVKGDFQRRAMHELDQELQAVSHKIAESNAPGSQEWLQEEDPLDQPFLTLNFNIDYAAVMNAHDAMKVALDKRERQVRQALQLSGATLDSLPGQTCQWQESPNAPPCELRCHSETALQTHFECKHTAPLPKSVGLICRWSGCPAKAGFSQRLNRNRHIQSHTGHKAYPCTLCSHAFSTMRRIKTPDIWRNARRDRFNFDKYSRRRLAMLQLMYLKDRAVLWKRRSVLLRAETRSAQAPTKTVVLGRDSNITITLFGIDPSLSPKHQEKAFGDDSTSMSLIRGGLLTPDISDSNDEDFNIIVAEAPTEACSLLNERELLEPQMISISAQVMESLLRNSRLMCHMVILSEGREARAKRFLEDKDHRERLATLQIMYLEERAALRMRKSGLLGVESGSAQAPVEVIELREDRDIIIMLVEVVMSLSAELERESDGDETVSALPLRGGALSPDSSDSSDEDYNTVAKAEEAITEARALLREQISAVESRDLASHFRHAQEERRIEAMGLEEPDEEDEKTRAGDIRDLQQQAHEKEKGELKKAHEKIEAPLQKRKEELLAIERARTVASPNMAKTNGLIVTSDAVEVSQSPPPSPHTPVVRLPLQTTQPGDGSSSVGQLRGGTPSQGQRGCRCPLCHHRFRTAQALALHSHMRTHIGDNPYKFKEPDCEYEAAYGTHLTMRTITKHNGDKPLVCDEPECGRRFAVPDNLARHREIRMRLYEMADMGGAGTAPGDGRASLGQLRGGSSEADFQDILEANEVHFMLAGLVPLPYLGPCVDPGDFVDPREEVVAERAEEIKGRGSFSDSPVVGVEPPVATTGSIEEQHAPPRNSQVPELDMAGIEDGGQRESGQRYPEQLPLPVWLGISGLNIATIEYLRQKDSGQLCPEQLPVSDPTSMQDAPKANGRGGFLNPSDAFAAIIGRKTILDVMMMERVRAADAQYYARSYAEPRPGAEIQAGGAASSVLYSSSVVSKSPSMAMARRETFKLQGEDAQGWCYYNSSGMIFRDAVKDDPPVFPNWPGGVLPQPIDRGSVLHDASEVRMADPVLAKLAASQQPIHDSQQTSHEQDDLWKIRPVVTEWALRMGPHSEAGVQLPPISSILENMQLPPVGRERTSIASLRSTHSIGLSTSAFLRNVRQCARYVKDFVRNDRHWLPSENNKSQPPHLHTREVSFEPDSESENEGPAKSIFPIPAPLDTHTAAELDAKLEASLTESAKVARWKDELPKVEKGKLSFSGLNRRVKNTLHGSTYRTRGDSSSSDESDRLIEDADSELKKARIAKFIHRWNNYAHEMGGWWHTKHDKELQAPKQYLPPALQHVKIAPPEQGDFEEFVFECNPALRELFVENPYNTAEFRKSNKIGLFQRVQAAKRKRELEQERERGNGDEMEVVVREFMMSKCKGSERNVWRGRPRGGCLDEEEVVEVATVGRMKDGRRSLLADDRVWRSKKRKRECSGGCSFVDDATPLGVFSELPPAKRRKLNHETRRPSLLWPCHLPTPPRSPTQPLSAPPGLPVEPTYFWSLPGTDLPQSKKFDPFRLNLDFILIEPSHTRKFDKFCSLNAQMLGDIGRAFISKSSKTDEMWTARPRGGCLGEDEVMDPYQTTTAARADVLVTRYCSQLNLNEFIFEKVSRGFATKVADLGIMDGRSPLSATAACVYLASQWLGKPKSKKDITAVTGVTGRTIGIAYRFLYEEREHLVDPGWLKGENAKMENLSRLKPITTDGRD